MYRIERAVSDWLRHRKGAPPADLVAAGEDLVEQVSRLQDEEEQALRAIDAALLAAKARAVDCADRRSAGATAR